MNPGDGNPVHVDHIGPGADADTFAAITKMEVLSDGASGYDLVTETQGVVADSLGHITKEAEGQFDVPLSKVTVVTDYRVDSNKLQKKTQVIWVLRAETESGWTDVHTGTTCA